jgi:hypothetical protein
LLFGRDPSIDEILLLNSFEKIKSRDEQISDYGIDNVTEYLLKRLDIVKIKKEEIKFIQFTEISGWIPNIIQLYDIQYPRYDIRDKMLKEVIKKIGNNEICKRQLDDFKDSLLENRFFFESELLDDGGDEFLKVRRMLLEED